MMLDARFDILWDFYSPFGLFVGDSLFLAHIGPGLSA